jgi:membrane-bound serine protease (ClpP class)
LCLFLGSGILVAQSSRTALVLTVKDAIGPATSDFIHNGLNQARERNASLVVLRLDTPGGLDTSMRDIIRDILASPVPVATYVSPSGARAASAGTYILYASHIAAMAPGTNLGAATPVQIGGLPDLIPKQPEEKKEKPAAGQDDGKGVQDQQQEGSKQEEGSKQGKNKSGSGTDGGQASPAADTGSHGDAMSRKMINDAVAYIRSLAELRGRNADWAEQAVRAAASLSAVQARDSKVVDLVAKDVPDLLRKIDGRVVDVNNEQYTLHTANLDLEYLEPDWRTKFLAVITNPNVAYILMLLGIYGLFFELANPGFVLPGVIGGISLLLALYSLQVLPINYAGLGLILLGIAFMIAELFVPSFGALGIGGIVAFVIGSIILFDVEGGNMAISMPLIIAVSILSGAFFLVVVRSIINAHRKPVVSGAEEIIGNIGSALGDFDTRGMIHMHGEDWQVESSSPVKEGERVRVVSRDGLILKVQPLEENKK